MFSSVTTYAGSLLLGLTLVSVSARASARRQHTGPVSLEQYGNNEASATLLILLHGVSGPTKFYRDQAKFFAKHGFYVILPHYLDAGDGASATESNYRAWVAAVRLILNAYESKCHRPSLIVGYSLGASVALALGSQGEVADGIVDFYGSLPYRYYRDLRGMPPLLILHGEKDPEIPVLNAVQLSRLCKLRGLDCEVDIYPKEEHGFSEQVMKDADSRALRFFSRVLTKSTDSHESNCDN